MMRLNEYPFFAYNGKHIPLIRCANTGCMVFRGKPNTPGFFPCTCIRYVRNNKTNRINSYKYLIYKDFHPVTSIDECNDILRDLEESENYVRSTIKNIMSYRRGLKRMLVEVNNIPVKESNIRTPFNFKYGNDEYFFEWSIPISSDSFLKSLKLHLGEGLCHYTVDKFRQSKTIQLGTNNVLEHPYLPMSGYGKTFCLIRTRGDLRFVKRKLPSWVRNDIEWRSEELKGLREHLLRIKCMRYETELEKEYLSSPELQKKEQDIIKKQIKEAEEKEAKEYAERPRYDIKNIVELWDGKIYWQCGKCLEKNISHKKNISPEEECSYCRGINKINTKKEPITA